MRWVDEWMEEDLEFARDDKELEGFSFIFPNLFSVYWPMIQRNEWENIAIFIRSIYPKISGRKLRKVLEFSKDGSMVLMLQFY